MENASEQNESNDELSPPVVLPNLCTIRGDDPDSILESFKCLLNEKHSHYFYEPRLLPCSNTACNDCISKLIDKETHILKCSLCNQEHKIENVNSLELNQEIIEQINQNWNKISDELLNKLDYQVDFMKSRTSVHLIFYLR